jgi:Ca2+-binding EF-hand superfamily protein
MSSELREILKDENKIKLVAQKAFDIVDTDKSGFISLDELEDLMRGMALQLGIPAPSHQDVCNAFKEIDTDKKNRIGINEFTNLVREVIRLLAN